MTGTQLRRFCESIFPPEVPAGWHPINFPPVAAVESAVVTRAFERNASPRAVVLLELYTITAMPATETALAGQTFGSPTLGLRPGDILGAHVSVSVPQKTQRPSKELLDEVRAKFLARPELEKIESADITGSRVAHLACVIPEEFIQDFMRKAL